MKLKSHQHSGGWGGSFARGETWDEFDALPEPVRRLYKLAPYRYTASPVVDYFAAGGSDVAMIVRTQIASMKAAIRRETRRIYGPAHPQAGAPE